jgi:hypothetical protein
MKDIIVVVELRVLRMVRMMAGIHFIAVFVRFACTDSTSKIIVSWRYSKEA